MTYRQIHTQIWKDDWFMELEADEKLLFIYLFSNENTTLAGIYKLNLKVAAFETGLPIERIKVIIESFARAGKVVYASGIIWVVNLMRYNATSQSPKVKTAIDKALAMIPDCNIKAAYLAGRIPYQYPMDTVLNSNSNNTETETDQEQQQLTDGASAVVGSCFQLYTQEIGKLSKFTSEKIGDMIDEYTEAWVKDAIEIASLNNVRKLTYIEGVLRNWKANGKDASKVTPDDDQAYRDRLKADAEKWGYAA